MATHRTDVVSATEIASWAWCPESWRLQALGKEPGNTSELSRGRDFHTRSAGFEVASRRRMRLGFWLLVLALVIGGLWVALVTGAGQ